MKIMLDFYSNNLEIKNQEYVADRAYKKTWHEEEVFRRLQEEWNNWEDFLGELIVENIKAANWFADIVRREIDPTFFVSNGKFSLEGLGGEMGLTPYTIVFEYSDEEKSQLSSQYQTKINNLKAKAESIKI